MLINIEGVKMKEKKSDVLKKIEEAVDQTKKRLFEIKKENDPNLDWKKFSKSFDTLKDKSDAMLKNKLFQEEIEKIIQAETDSNTKLLLSSIKDAIDFETLPDEKKKYFPSFIVKALVLITRFMAFYFISVITFGLFSYFLTTPIWYIFLLSLITSLLFMLCDLPSRSVLSFIYDPFLSLKVTILLIIIMMFVNHEFYQIFDSSIIWLIFIPLCLFLHNILGRNIHKLWWRY